MGSEIHTPHIDGMAANGILLSAMYNCARCCPTRASLLTGLYPHKAGIGHMGANLGTPAYQGFLRQDTVTIAEVLKVAGYRTPVDGLLIGGHWAEYGGGVPMAVKAASNAAAIVLKKDKPQAFKQLCAVLDQNLA